MYVPIHSMYLLVDAFPHAIFLSTQCIDRDKDRLTVLECCKARDFGSSVDVVRLLDAHHHLDQVGVPDSVSKPQASQPSPFAEGPAYHEVIVFRKEVHGGDVAEIGVGFVHTKQAVFLHSRRAPS